MCSNARTTITDLYRAEGKAELVKREIVHMAPGSTSASRTGRLCSPDAAYYTGPHIGMRFLEGAPIFAVEMRSVHDYGRTAESELKSLL
jgi:hypothetical protein